jgi:hypothetical protein
MLFVVFYLFVLGQSQICPGTMRCVCPRNYENSRNLTTVFLIFFKSNFWVNFGKQKISVQKSYFERFYANLGAVQLVSGSKIFKRWNFSHVGISRASKAATKYRSIAGLQFQPVFNY